MNLVESADFRIKKNGDILMIIEDTLFSYDDKLEVILNNDLIKGTGSFANLKVYISNPILLYHLHSAKNISLIQNNSSGFFQLLDNIKIKLIF